MAFFELFNINIQEMEFNAWIQLFEKRRFFGIQNIATVETAKKLIVRRDCYMVATFLALILELTLTYLLQSHNLPWNVPTTFMRVLCYSIQAYVTIDLNQKIEIVGLVLSTLNRTIKEALIKNTYPIFCTKKGDLSLEKFLGRCSKFVLIIYINMVLFVQYMRTALVLYCVATISSLILNIYVLIQYSDTDSHVLFATDLKTLFMIGRMVSVCMTAEYNLNVKVSGDFGFRHFCS